MEEGGVTFVGEDNVVPVEAGEGGGVKDGRSGGIKDGLFEESDGSDVDSCLIGFLLER